MRRIFFLLVTLVMSLAEAMAEEGILYTSDKLSSNLVTSIVQDHRGYIWVGTQNGLNRFDGYRFTPYYYKEGDPNTLPHNEITTLFIDRDGTLWAGTPKGLAYYDEATNRFCRQKVRIQGLDEPRITQLAQNKDGVLMVGTSGFKVFEVKKGRQHGLQRWCYGGVGQKTDFDYFPAITYDRQGHFWFGNKTGNIYCFVPKKNHTNAKLLFKDHPSLGLPVRILQLRNGNLMVAFMNGFAVYSSSYHCLAKRTTPYVIESLVVTHKGEILVGTNQGIKMVDDMGNDRGEMQVDNEKVNFSTMHASALLEDAQHNLWVGCGTRGLLFLGNRQSVFNLWSLSAKMSDMGSRLNTIAPAADGGVWGAVSNGSLYHFDRQGHISRTISVPGNLGIIAQDRLGRLWVSCGTRVYSFDEKSGGMSFCATYDCDFVRAIDSDKMGRIYVSTFGKGVAMYDPKTGKSRQLSMFQTTAPRGFLCNDWVYTVFTDSQGMVWMATSSGISCYNPAKDTFKPFGWHNLLEGYSCLSVAEERGGSILVGTDRGIFRFDKRKNRLESLHLDLIINAIQAEPNGDIWCSTSMGIWHYKKTANRWLEHINDDGLKEREYTQGVNCKLTDRRIAFGNSEGVVCFLPAQVEANKKTPVMPVLSSLLLGDQVISMETLSDGRQITSMPVSQSKSFELSYIDNTFTLEFSNFDYSDARNISLEYRLNDDPWLMNGNGDNTITFRHLSPGYYRLYVRVVKNGVASQTEVYNIQIRGPWYTSPLAYVFYILLFLLVAGYAIYRYYRHRNEELAEEKMQFIINATHDIRTPLTLILSPLHQLMRRKDNDEEQVQRLNLIDHNAQRILNLVNQILDLRKIDKQQMTLKQETTDMVPMVHNIFKGFESHAAERHIQFSFTHPEHLEAWVDRIQMDKVVQNLLSNAFKFTPDGGSVELRLTQANGRMKIQVLDTGTGLNAADIPHLFSRFYQSVATQALGKTGTGIGLNLCKMIVEMHHGKISAQNRQDVEHGSVFCVEIPIGEEQMKQASLITPESDNQGSDKADNQVSSDKSDCQGSDTAGKLGANKTGKPYILLVDDDAEITDYIATELCASYQCEIANNGKEALGKLLSPSGTKYKLVVSDILMPEMDGFTLLRAIKSNLAIAHLPVILLTSESAVGNRLEGLRHGADAFMAKPFMVEELKMQIDNLLGKTRLMKAHFSGHVEEHKDQVEQRDLADNDKKLMDRIMESINKNLGDSEFSVEQLAADAGLSRSQLHRKMKDLTGISPSEFIRNIRLEQAARLLKERKVNVSQVAYTLGFNSPGSFSKVFKQHFGVSPTEYISQEP